MSIPKLTISSLGEPAITYPPSAWEELARELENDRKWNSAMAAWKKAMGATAGHGRRDYYSSQAARCGELDGR